MIAFTLVAMSDIVVYFIFECANKTLFYSKLKNKDFDKKIKESKRSKANLFP
jgi:lauroyl/myristoyl acyltransferase